MARNSRQQPVVNALTPPTRVPLRRRHQAKSALITLFVAVAVVAGGLWGFSALWQYVTGLDEFALVPGEQDVGDLSGAPLSSKRWLNFDNLKADWLSGRSDPTGVLRRRTSLFAQGLTQRVSEALRNMPWVMAPASGVSESPEIQTVFVQRRFPNRLEIRIQLRRPACVVADPKTSYLVDEEGVVLNPRFYRLTDEIKERPVLKFLFDPGVPEFGKIWADDGVNGGLHLMRVLDEKRFLAAVPLAEIRIAQAKPGSVGYTRTLTLIPKRGGEIIWGSPPVVPVKLDPPAEAPLDTKLNNLVKETSYYKNVLPNCILDVRLKSAIVRFKESEPLDMEGDRRSGGR